MHTLPSTIAFRLEYVLFYQFCAKIAFFDQEKFGTAPLLSVDVETFGSKWRQDVKNDVKRQNRHSDVLHGSRLGPTIVAAILER